MEDRLLVVSFCAARLPRGSAERKHKTCIPEQTVSKHRAERTRGRTGTKKAREGGARGRAGRRARKTKAMSPSLSGTVLKKRWKLGALVGKGGCAEVYEAIDTGDSESAGAGPFVAKVARMAVGLPPAIKKGKKRKKTEQEKLADMIYYEYMLYNGFLLNHGGVAKVRTDGK